VGIYSSPFVLGVGSFLYHNGEFSEFNVPRAVYTVALAINNKGQIAGYYYSADSGSAHGFVATPKKKKELLASSSSESARKDSADIANREITTRDEGKEESL
jgi:hypothetical protein